MTKRIITLIIAALIFLPTVFTYAMYDDVSLYSENYEKIKLLSALGVLEDEGEFAEESFVTRAQFSKIMVKMGGFLDEFEPTHTGFSDIPENYSYSGYIKKAAEMKLLPISGQEFSPEEGVTIEEFVKASAFFLGYDLPEKNILANTKSWFIALMKGVSFANDTKMTKAQLASLLYNMLFVDCSKAVNVNGANYIRYDTTEKYISRVFFCFKVREIVTDRKSVV